MILVVIWSWSNRTELPKHNFFERKNRIPNCSSRGSHQRVFSIHFWYWFLGFEFFRNEPNSRISWGPSVNDVLCLSNLWSPTSMTNARYRTSLILNIQTAPPYKKNFFEFLSKIMFCFSWRFGSSTNRNRTLLKHSSLRQEKRNQILAKFWATLDNMPRRKKRRTIQIK